jgi:aspartate racemase
MKILGIIGGIGPESTIEYYRAILAAYRERQGDVSAPSIFINSIDLHKLLELVAAGQLEALTGYLVEELERLRNAGATLGILAANTPHLVFDDVVRRSAIPLLSIVDATCEEATARTLARLGLFGTRFTMEGHFYQDVFSPHGMTIVVPAKDEQAYIHNKYTTELLRSVFLLERAKGCFALLSD